MYSRFVSRIFVLLAVLGVLIASILSAPAAIAAPAARAPIAAPSSLCPPVLFIGAHGVNEGAVGVTPDEAHWGTTIQHVWNRFHTLVPGAEAKSGGFRYVPVDWPSVQTLAHALSVASQANDYADELKAQVVGTFRFSGRCWR